MGINQFIFRYLGREQVFQLRSATIVASRTEAGIRVVLEVEGAPIKTPPGAAPVYPRAKVAFVVESMDPMRLVGQQFSVPQGRTKEGDVASYRYNAEDELNDNVVEFLERKYGRFHVRWTGTMSQVDDRGPPLSKMEIEGWFHFKQIEKWIDR